jgi:hypothetical protein
MGMMWLRTAMPRPRATSTIRKGDGYRVLGPMPPDETWMFAPGGVVKCQERAFQVGTRGLVAVSRGDR